MSVCNRNWKCCYGVCILIPSCMAASLRAAAVLCLRDLKREAVDLGHQCLGQPEGKTLPGGTLDFLPGNGFAIAGRYVVCSVRSFYIHAVFCYSFWCLAFFCPKGICKYVGRRIEMSYKKVDRIDLPTFHADVKVTCVHTNSQKLLRANFSQKKEHIFRQKFQC